MKASSMNEMRVLTAAETEAVAGGINWGMVWKGIKTIVKGLLS